MPPTRFACQYLGCTANYRRKEHLHRHEAQHRGTLVSTCPFCGRTFSRGDALRRHVRRDHKDSHLDSSRAAQACESCRSTKIRCQGGQPCMNCQEKGRPCVFTPSEVDKRLGNGDQEVSVEPATGSAETEKTDKVQHCLHLYFSQFHRHWPILHYATFDIEHEPPFLVQAVVMVGLWVGGTETEKRGALELHESLGRSILEQIDNWNKTFQEQHDQNQDENNPASRWPIATYQGILLYLIVSLVSAGRKSESLDLTLSVSTSDRDILSALIEACQRNNIFNYPHMLDRYRGIQSITCIWVGVEEIKRLGLALHKVCRLVGESDQPNHYSLRLSDLQFPVPGSRHLWEAKSNPELSRLLQLENGQAREDGSNESNWVSSFGQFLDGRLDPWWI